MKKTTAIAAFAVSGALLLSACGGSDVTEVALPESTTEETTTETEDPNAPTVVEENQLPEPKIEVSEDAEEVVVAVGDSLRVDIDPWFPACESIPVEYVTDPETNEVEAVGGYFPGESFVKEFDSAYLSEPEISPSDDVVLNEDGSIDLEASLEAKDASEDEAADAREPGETFVLHNSGDSSEMKPGFVLIADQPGTTQLRVAYSCEPTGDEFDTTWTIKINP